MRWMISDLTFFRKRKCFYLDLKCGGKGILLKNSICHDMKQWKFSKWLLFACELWER